MSAKRKAIRQAIVTELRGNTACGTNVFGTRTRPFFAAELPAIGVYFSTESAEVFNKAPRELLRTAKMVCEIIAQGKDGVDDVLDDIGQQVEDRLHNKDDWDEKLSDIVVVSAQCVVNGEGDDSTVSLLLTFDAEYLEDAPREEAQGGNITDFNKVISTMTPPDFTATTPSDVQEIDLPQI